MLRVCERIVSTHSRPKAAGQLVTTQSFDSSFQHTAARRRLARRTVAGGRVAAFQHTAARRRLDAAWPIAMHPEWRFNTQPPEGGWQWQICCLLGRSSCFNTQPPEGGWSPVGNVFASVKAFQHTAARRRLGTRHRPRQPPQSVSTHSRPKAAGSSLPICVRLLKQFQHTAARRRLAVIGAWLM